MSSAPPIERFKGTDWEECDDFVAAVRARALWEGKQRDPAWIADFAAPLFSRTALSWHCRLPQDVRQDWFKLEIALIDRWPPPDDGGEPQIRPTPAAAPSLNHNDRSDRQLCGRLKLVLDQSSTTYYVAPPRPVCDLVRNTNQALRVRCNSFSGATLLEPLSHSCHSWLAVQWGTSNPNIEKGSTDSARVTYVDSAALKSAWSQRYPFQLLTCSVLANGELIPVWKKDASGTKSLSLFVGGSGRCFYLVPDTVVYGRGFGEYIRARLFIQSTD